MMRTISSKTPAMISACFFSYASNLRRSTTRNLFSPAFLISRFSFTQREQILSPSYMLRDSSETIRPHDGHFTPVGLCRRLSARWQSTHQYPSLSRRRFLPVTSLPQRQQIFAAPEAGESITCVPEESGGPP